MKELRLGLLFLCSLLPLTFPADVSGERSKRQAPVGVLNPPIPTSVAQYLGNNQQVDNCPRDEVQMPDGNCYQVLTQGPCAVTEQVLLDPDTNQGYCAPRLCSPDRIFVFSDQMCHDPRNTQLCPPGRQLYQTSYGTPVCQCPDGTYEGDDDLDDDVCEPLLGQTLTCPAGQVFWFRDFSLPPECLPDPCGGDNLNRGPNDLPFVPSADGRCFQLGSMQPVCPAQTWYSIALDKLQGVCSTLEDAGYQVFDAATLARLAEIYGPLIPRDATAPIPVASGTPGPSTGPSLSGGVSRPTTQFAGQPSPDLNLINGAAQTGGRSPLVSGIQTGTGIPSGTVSQGSVGQGTISQSGFGIASGTGGQRVVGSQTPGTSVQGISSGVTGQTIGFDSQIATGAQRGQGAQGSGIQIPVSSGVRPSVHSSSRPQVHQTAPSTSGQIGVSSQPTLGGLGSQGPGGFVSPPATSAVQLPFTPLPGRPATYRPPVGSGGHSSVIPLSGQSGILPSVGSAPQGSGAAFQRPTAHTVSAGALPSAHSSSSVAGPPQGFSQTSFAPQSWVSGHYAGAAGGPPKPSVSSAPLAQTGITSSGDFTGFPEYDSGQDDASFEDFGMGGYSYPEPQGRHVSSVRMAKLLAEVSLRGNDNSKHDLSSLHYPAGHELHGFFNGVREIVTNLPNSSSSHYRVRRSPLPHATPGNVFETRLVGCRAGAQRDINAKCRNTVLPAQTPASRPSRAVPSVPPAQSCPSGQAFNLRRMCEPVDRAIASINAFNLG